MRVPIEMETGPFAAGPCEASEHESRLKLVSRYGESVKRSRQFGEYLGAAMRCNPQAVLRGRKLCGCGSWLYLREFLASGSVRVLGAKFCQQHLLCGFCAARYAARAAMRYRDRVEAAVASDSSLVPVMVTLTVRNGESLPDVLSVLDRALRSLFQPLRLRRSASHHFVVRFGVAGAIAGIEVKRGSRSGLWHPHAHLLVLMRRCDWSAAQSALSDEWKALTGGSHVVELHPVVGELVGAVLEVSKYIVKFSDGSFSDVWRAFEVCHRRRMRRGYGVLYSAVKAEALTDEVCDEGEFVDWFYRFVAGEFTPIVSRRCSA